MSYRSKPEPKYVTEETELTETFADLANARYYVVGLKETARYVDTGKIRHETHKYWVKDRYSNKILPVPGGYGWWQSHIAARIKALKLNTQHAKGEI